MMANPLTTAMSFLVRHAPADPRDGSLTYNEEQTMSEEDTKERESAETLYKALRKDCDGHSLPAIGTALSAVIVDFAQYLGMSKEEFMGVISNTWDYVEAEDEVKH
jgi:hypothetical protein